MVDMQKVIPSSVVKSLDELVECLNSTNDIRLCLLLMVPVAFPFRGLIDIVDDPEIRFMSYMITDQLGNIQTAYDGRTSEWYRLNAANISEMRKSLSDYCKTIRDSILSNDYRKFIDGTAVFFNKTHLLMRATTMDTRERE